MKAHLEKVTKGYQPKTLVITIETQGDEDMLRELFRMKVSFMTPLKTSQVNSMLNQLREALGE